MILLIVQMLLVTVKLFADYANLYMVISDESSAANLQSSLDYV